SRRAPPSSRRRPRLKSNAGNWNESTSWCPLTPGPTTGGSLPRRQRHQKRHHRHYARPPRSRDESSINPFDPIIPSSPWEGATMPDAITQKLLDERDDIVSRANGVKKTALEQSRDLTEGERT